MHTTEGSGIFPYLSVANICITWNYHFVYVLTQIQNRKSQSTRSGKQYIRKMCFLELHGLKCNFFTGRSKMQFFWLISIAQLTVVLPFKLFLLYHSFPLFNGIQLHFFYGQASSWSFCRVREFPFCCSHTDINNIQLSETWEPENENSLVTDYGI